MNIPMIPRHVVVMRSENLPYVPKRISRVRHYDEAMKDIFAYFVVVPTDVAGQFTDALGRGYVEEGYGPFWPSFASMNSGDDTNKVLWLSEAAVHALRRNLQGEFYFQLEPVAEALLLDRETSF